MPPQNFAGQSHQPGPGTDAEPGATGLAAPVSRRSLLRGAAGVGAAGLAVAAGGGALLAAARPAHAAASGTGPDSAADAAGDEPIVAYLRDAATGEFEVFHGTRQVRVRDRKLAVQ